MEFIIGLDTSRDRLAGALGEECPRFALPRVWVWRLINGCAQSDLASAWDHERLRVRWKLQHRAGLSDAKPRQEHDLPAWKFQSIVMFVGALEIDLPEARDLLFEFSPLIESERVVAFDVLIKT